MKKLLIALLPLLVAGCIIDYPTDKTTVQATQCVLRARASGTTGSTEYTCERLACGDNALTFHCEFTNVSNEYQPGVSAKIGFYSEDTHFEVAHSETIYANALTPGQSDFKVLRLDRAPVAKVCGASLENCVFLVDRIWPK